MYDALTSVIGYDEIKEGGKQILDGIFVSPIRTPKHMQKALDRLRKIQIVIPW